MDTKDLVFVTNPGVAGLARNLANELDCAFTNHYALLADRESDPTARNIVYVTYEDIPRHATVHNPRWREWYDRARNFYTMNKIEQLLFASHFVPTVLAPPVASGKAVYRYYDGENRRRRFILGDVNALAQSGVLHKSLPFVERTIELRLVFFRGKLVAAYTRRGKRQDTPWNRQGIEEFRMPGPVAMLGHRYIEALGNMLRAIGYNFAGVDIIIAKADGKPYLLEVNSAPGVSGPIKQIVLPKLVEAVKQHFKVV